MVKAILEGSKTMTRRVIKLIDFEPGTTKGYDWSWRNKRLLWNEMTNDDFVKKMCPYGQVGDRLWVKETDYLMERNMTTQPVIVYKADQSDPKCITKWKSGRFMFKKYARLCLEITNIRVERLQEISEEDAEKEGDPKQGLIASENDHTTWFQGLWDSINGKNHPWSSNPWVWVIEFRRV
jgi:hypothetical protein